MRDFPKFSSDFPGEETPIKNKTVIFYFKTRNEPKKCEN